MLKYSSKLIADAVAEFTKLPGIGEKTALRLVIHLLKQDKDKVKSFGDVVTKMRHEIQYCKTCHNISDTDQCSVCANKMRDPSIICVVENFRDVIAIENTEIYRGTYHVLDGIISPIDGIGPEQLNIESLIRRVREQDVKEVLMALATTIEGDTTVFYLSKRLQPMGVSVSTIARGMAFGGELEYTDEVTLARSIVKRIPYESGFVNSSS